MCASGNTGGTTCETHHIVCKELADVGSAMSSAENCATGLIAPVTRFHPRHHWTALKPLLNNTSHQITAFPRTSPEQRVKTSRDQEPTIRGPNPDLRQQEKIMTRASPKYLSFNKFVVRQRVTQSVVQLWFCRIRPPICNSELLRVGDPVLEKTMESARGWPARSRDCGSAQQGVTCGLWDIRGIIQRDHQRIIPLIFASASPCSR
jgi:hypothetical protein